MRQSKNMYFYGLIEECINSMDDEHHCVFEHSFKSDEQLKTRISCRQESIRGASCFNEGDDIVEIVSDIIYDAPEVLPWLKLDEPSGKSDLRLVQEVPNCGKKYLRSYSHNWENGPIVCNKIVIILGKKLDKAGCVVQMYIKSAYPE